MNTPTAPPRSDRCCDSFLDRLNAAADANPPTTAALKHDFHVAHCRRCRRRLDHWLRIDLAMQPVAAADGRGGMVAPKRLASALAATILLAAVWQRTLPLPLGDLVPDPVASINPSTRTDTGWTNVHAVFRSGSANHWVTAMAPVLGTAPLVAWQRTLRPLVTFSAANESSTWIGPDRWTGDWTATTEPMIAPPPPFASPPEPAV